MATTATKSSTWGGVVNDENDWTQVGDPVKRRQIQNRISKRRQRERIRQQKAKAKEAQAKHYEQLFHGPFRSSSSLTPTSHESTPVPPPRIWRTTFPGNMPRLDCRQTQVPYDTSLYPTVTGSLCIPGLGYSSHSDASPVSSAGSTTSYWHGQSARELTSQISDNPIHDPSDHSRSPFKSPIGRRPSPLSHPNWHPLDIRGPETTSESVTDVQLPTCQLQATVPTLPSTGSYSYSPIEAPYAQIKSTSSDERVKGMIACPHVMGGYPSFDFADYLTRPSPQA